MSLCKGRVCGTKAFGVATPCYIGGGGGGGTKLVGGGGGGAWLEMGGGGGGMDAGGSLEQRAGTSIRLKEKNILHPNDECTYAEIGGGGGGRDI